MIKSALLVISTLCLMYIGYGFALTRNDSQKRLGGISILNQDLGDSLCQGLNIDLGPAPDPDPCTEEGQKILSEKSPVVDSYGFPTKFKMLKETGYELNSKSLFYLNYVLIIGVFGSIAPVSYFGYKYVKSKRT